MLENEGEAVPLEMMIKCQSDRLFQLTAEELLNSGFLITESNSELYLLTTDYNNFDPAFLKGLFAGLMGIENLMIALSAMIVQGPADSSKLIIRGKVRYTERQSILERSITGKEDKTENQINMAIRKGSDMYKPIETLAYTIKEIAEK